VRGRRGGTGDSQKLCSYRQKLDCNIESAGTILGSHSEREVSRLEQRERLECNDQENGEVRGSHSWIFRKRRTGDMYWAVRDEQP
jgi:hypothetical protein